MKRMNIVTLLGATCATALVLGSARPAWAQTEPASASQQTAPDTGTGSAEAENGGSGDIVVTAQKRKERLKDVPVSIVVLRGLDLQEQSADTLEDYVARVPGLSLNARGLGQQQLAIRGVSTGAGFASTVATYIDDAPVGASNGDGTGGLVTPEIDSVDLSRIEVLRGPQGTLYGASNVGGLLKYVTVAPNLGQFDAAGSIEGSTAAHGDQGYAVRGRISVPVATDKAAILVSAYIRRDPGFIDDDLMNRTNLDDLNAKGFRVALALEPVERLRINVAAIGSNKKADGFTQIDADPITLEPLYGDYTQRRPGGTEFQRTKVRLYYGTIAYDLSFGELSSTTSYNTVHNRSQEDVTSIFGPFFPGGFGFPNLAFAGSYLINQNKFTEEVRLSGKIADKFDWLVGGYYTREHSSTGVTFPTFDGISGKPIDIGLVLLNAVVTGRYRETAGFAQGTFHFGPQFNLTAGIRYAKNRQHATTFGEGLFAGGTSTVETRAEGSATTFTVSPSYKISRDVTLYARVATGYRPGGSNTLSSPVLSYGPDRVTNYEVGLKGALDGGRISFDVDSFYVVWTDIQLRVQSPVTGLSYTDNVGKASSRGVEANVSYRLSSAFNVGATATYVDAHLDRDIPLGTYGLKGDPLPYAPKWKIAATADYKQDLGGDLKGFVGGSLFYTSEIRGEFRNSAVAIRSQLPDYLTVDGRAGISRGPLTLALVAKNIFDKRGYNGITQRTLAPDGPVALNIIQPRTLSLALRYNY